MSKDLCHWSGGELIRCSKNTVKTIKDPFCRHCGGDLRKSSEIIPGLFGKFQDDSGAYGYNYLHHSEDSPCGIVYVDVNGDYWDHFIPGLPAEKVEISVEDEEE